MRPETTLRRRAFGSAALAVALVAPLLAPGSAAGADDTAHVDPAATAGVPDSIAAPDTASVAADCADAAERLVLTVSTHLDPACDWTAGVDIVASDVVLDCQGATIRKNGGGRGILVESPIDTDMTGVVIRNCHVDGFLNSIRVTRDGFRTLAEGVEFVNELSGTVIEHTEVQNSVGVGIFVDGYTSDTVIRDSIVTNAGSAGIYLETGSKGSTVERNVIHDNGFRENGPDGQLRTVLGQQFRFWGSGREGVAVDGSFENVIRQNSFAGNSAGGVFLYKNCGEFPDRPAYFERRYGANDNVIEQNRFVGGNHGVWVGQRMGENTLPMDCTDEAYVDELLRRVVLDFAERNQVRHNEFVDVTYGIRVEDDGTLIEGNRFTAPTAEHHAVIIGTPLRTEILGRPVADTTLIGNHADITDNPNPYRWVHGYDGLVVDDNTTGGNPVGICEGATLPVQPFIWVLAAAFEPPGSPVTPTPDDLSFPTVGALDSCEVVQPPKVITGWAAAVEGDELRIPVRLTGPSDQTVRVHWRTLPVAVPVGQATADVDYRADSGVLEFAIGETEAVIVVQTLPDDRREFAEFLVVSTSQPDNARIGGIFGLGFGFVTDPWPN